MPSLGAHLLNAERDERWPPAPDPAPGERAPLLDDGQRWRFLARAGRALAGTLNLRRTSALAAHLTAEALADHCAVTLRSEAGVLETVVAPAASGTHRPPRVHVGEADGSAASGEDTAREAAAEPPGEAGAVARVLRTGLAERHDAVPWDRLATLVPPGFGPVDGPPAAEPGSVRRTVLLVPLLARGSCFGVMTLIRSRPYEAAELSLAGDLAERVAVALDAARLYEHEVRTAEVLRSVLLPAALPQIEGLRLGAAYRAAADGSLIGGDFYEVLREPDGRWLIALGDVSGKGLEAAVYSGRVRQTLYAAATIGDGPVQTLSLLNRTLLMSEMEGRFVTLVTGRAEPHPDGSVRVVLAAGGHLPPLVLRRTGEVERLGLEGTLVGVLEDARFDETETILAPGDALYLYTDGVLEARDPQDEMYGEERLIRELTGCAGAPPGAVAERLEQLVLEHSRHREHDDIAVLGLQAWPAGRAGGAAAGGAETGGAAVADAGAGS